MKGHLSTYLSLFDKPQDDRPAITSIEIPIIQRDYAQGRPDDATRTIRDNFLNALISAVETGQPIGLDFIYGEVIDGGTLRPLDGQQRLTTLFLIHWYIASLAAHQHDGAATWDSNAPWLRFSYATRPSARAFTRALADNPIPPGVKPSEWITDQVWYLYPWKTDPTIDSMLVMLDGIYARLKDTDDFISLWERLTSLPADLGEAPISFLFLAVDDIRHGEDLYIKMNSRGKPLTSFEIFKADLEGIFAKADPERLHRLEQSIDGTWNDVLWKYETDDDFIVDQEFMRYLEFILDICEWRDDDADRRYVKEDLGLRRDKRRTIPLEKRAELAFVNSPNAQWNRDFFFHAFDTWVNCNPEREFNQILTAVGDSITAPHDAGATSTLPIFSKFSDLFGTALKQYGRDFTAQMTLLLYAVLLFRQNPSVTPEQFAKRIRSLRNISAANLDIERNMSKYISSVEKLIVDGDISGVEAFNREWVADEAAKWRITDEFPELSEAIHQLEDNPLLQGRLLAFDLEPKLLANRIATFKTIIPFEIRHLFMNALLSKGDYSRPTRKFRLLGRSAFTNIRKYEAQTEDELKYAGIHAYPLGLGSPADKEKSWNNNPARAIISSNESWSNLLTTGSREELRYIRSNLMALLDDVDSRIDHRQITPREALLEISNEWLEQAQQRQDYNWRYYFIRYPGTRAEDSNVYQRGMMHSRYYDRDRGGFSYSQLRVLHGDNYTSYFTDAVLKAIHVAGDFGDGVYSPDWWGHEGKKNPGMKFKHSQIEIRSEDDAFEIYLPDSVSHGVVEDALLPFSIEEGLDGYRVLIRKHEPEGDNFAIDAEDRVELGVHIVRALLEAGL